MTATRAQQPQPQGAFPSRMPIDINDDLWMYENPGSITVVIGRVGVSQARIPMRKLCLIVDRYRKYRAKRRKK